MSVSEFCPLSHDVSHDAIGAPLRRMLRLTLPGRGGDRSCAVFDEEHDGVLRMCVSALVPKLQTI